MSAKCNTGILLDLESGLELRTVVFHHRNRWQWRIFLREPLPASRIRAYELARGVKDTEVDAFSAAATKLLDFGYRFISLSKVQKAEALDVEQSGSKTPTVYKSQDLDR